MKTSFIKRFTLCLLTACTWMMAGQAWAQDNQINISRNGLQFGQPPVLIAMDGVTGEAAEVLRFDLYVQGFKFVGPDTAQYIIHGNGGTVGGTLTDAIARKALFSRNYNGAGTRRLAHAFADDIVFKVRGIKGIGQTQIAYKTQPDTGAGEIYMADFDGFNPKAVTHDNAVVAAPSWVPGHLGLYYNSYKLGNADIFYQNLATGQRKIIARYGGSSISPAVSPNGSKVAMVLSKGGSPDIYVADADGTNLRQLTHTPEDESSPCWSPDGQWICFATKIHERRVLAKVSVDGGEIQRIPTIGASSPSEPDWSPDGKYIAFTRQSGGFEICIVPAEGGNAVVLTEGEDPSWAPNSRTLVFNHSVHYRAVLSLLDVFTKQVKDIRQVSGSNSEAAWHR